MADTETAVATESLPVYFQYIDALTALDRTSQVEVRIHVATAQGYVWGCEDTSGARTPDDPWHFSLAYGLYVAEFYGEKRTSRSPVAQCYKHWKATGVICPEDGYSWKS